MHLGGQKIKSPTVFNRAGKNNMKIKRKRESLHKNNIPQN